jgi:uncharacterized protein with von Willebrand factor type A (vWA) domain
MEKDPEQQLQEELDRFVEFSTLLDRKSRKYLVWYLQEKVKPGNHEVPELNDQYFRYFQRALDGIFAVDGLLDLMHTNDQLNQQILLDTLYWLRKTWKKVREKHPFEEEQNRLENWSVTPLHVFLKRWPVLLQYLSQKYGRNEIDLGYYRERFTELFAENTIEALSNDQRKKADLIINDLLAQWDAQVYAKILEYQLQHLEEEKQAYAALLSAKVTEYNQLTDLIKPFSEYVGRYWDMSRELWKETSFDLLNQYDELLKNEKSVKELADLLGRLREAEIELEEETFEKTIIRQEWVKDPLQRTEIVGVRESDELSNLLSAEAGLLSNEDSELLFLKKYADKKLLTFRYEDQKLQKSEDIFTEVNQRVQQKEKGPFILCVDTSESMYGRPEQIAKVLCLGILKMAARDNRRAYLINFSTGIQTLDLFDIANSIDQIAKFLTMSFHGGTDVSLPLYEALRMLETHNYEDADVLMISDFIMYQIDEDVLNSVRHFQQNKGTQFHSIALSNDPNTKIIDAFDTNWMYDPKEKGVIRSLTQGLDSIRTRY